MMGVGNNRLRRQLDEQGKRLAEAMLTIVKLRNRCHALEAALTLHAKSMVDALMKIDEATKDGTEEDRSGAG
jgi:hypothetical protein